MNQNDYQQHPDSIPHYQPPQQRFQQPHPAPQPPKKKSKVLRFLLIGGVSLFVLGSCNAMMKGPESSTSTPTYSAESYEPAAEPVATQAPESTQEASAPAPAAPAEPAVSVSQRNAVKKAQSYLRSSSFSRTGLIKQLAYEGFSEEDSEYAVDNVTVDWDEQAEKKAKSYMESSSFSRTSLLKQLAYEGFTPAQAERGVNAVGL